MHQTHPNNRSVLKENSETASKIELCLSTQNNQFSINSGYAERPSKFANILEHLSEMSNVKQIFHQILQIDTINIKFQFPLHSL